MTKYNARPETINGIRFASQAEARRYSELLLLQQAGEIRELAVHPRYTIWEHRDRVTGKREKIDYEGDFSYYEDGWRVVEDVKGVLTPVYRLKRKMFRAMYPNIRFREVKAREV